MPVNQMGAWSDFANSLTRKEIVFLLKADSLFGSGRRNEARDQYSLACKIMIPRAVHLDSTAFQVANCETKEQAIIALQTTIAIRRVVKYATLRIESTFDGEVEKSAMRFVANQMDSTINAAEDLLIVVRNSTDENFRLTAKSAKFKKVLKEADPNEDYFATVTWNRKILIVTVTDGWYTLSDDDQRTYTNKLLVDWVAVLDLKTLSGVGIRMIDINGDTLASCGPDNFQKVHLLR